MPAARQFANQLLGAVAALVVADIDGCTLRGEQPHRRRADAAGAAGDDGDLALEALLLHALLPDTNSPRHTTSVIARESGQSSTHIASIGSTGSPLARGMTPNLW